MQEVFMRGGRPIKSWAVDVESGALDQAANLSKLPFAVRQIGLLPDAHQGYGAPIGSVFMADKAVVPYAIGVDIGCGVVFAETDLTVDQLPTDVLRRIAIKIDKDVPTGNGPGATHPEPKDQRIIEDLILAKVHGPDFSKVGDLIEQDEQAMAYFVSALDQVGTLGGGNHFIELQADETGKVYVMLHSGSRSYGYRVCKAALGTAKQLNEQWHSILPNPELAYLPVGTEDFDTYWARMLFGLAFAEVSRDLMLEAVAHALFAFAPMTSFDKVLDVHHNYAAWENHFGKNGIVHRKGAVRARQGELVAIPGSMGTGSYIGKGLGNVESFQTCQHGAGRAHTRTAMRKSMTTEQVFEEMERLGVVLVTSGPKTVMEEASGAYKDVESVMAQSADLVEPMLKLRPLAVVKG